MREDSRRPYPSSASTSPHVPLAVALAKAGRPSHHHLEERRQHQGQEQRRQEHHHSARHPQRHEHDRSHARIPHASHQRERFQGSDDYRAKVAHEDAVRKVISRRDEDRKRGVQNWEREMAREENTGNPVGSNRRRMVSFREEEDTAVPFTSDIVGSDALYTHLANFEISFLL